MEGAGRQFRYVVYPDKSHTYPLQFETSLEEFAGYLAHEETNCVLLPDDQPVPPGLIRCIGKECPNKDGTAWSSGYIPHGKKRANANVTGIDFAVFDIDDVPFADVEKLELALDGIECFLHSTHRHRPPDDNHVRLIIPMTRTMTPAEWPIIWRAMVREFGLRIATACPAKKKKPCLNHRDHGGVDELVDASRLSFLPRGPHGAPFENAFQQGRRLRPEEFLLKNLHFSQATQAAPGAPQEVPDLEPGAIDRDTLRARLKRYDPKDDYDGEKKAMVQRVLAEEAFCSPGARGGSVPILGGIIGLLMLPGTPVEPVLEIVRPSFEAALLKTDDPRTDSVEVYNNRFEDYYEKSQKRKLEELQNDLTINGRINALLFAKKQAREAALPPLAPPPLPQRQAAPVLAVVPPRASAPAVLTVAHAPPIIAPPRSVPTQATFDQHKEWELKLITTENDKGLTLTKNTPANIEIVLKHHPEWRGVLRYNVLTQEAEADGGPLSASERTPERLVMSIRNWCAHNAGLELRHSEFELAIEHVARENMFDPIEAYLRKQAPVWDGTRRLQTWLIDYCHARIVTDDGIDVTEYIKTVGMKWMMAGAARGLYPGCKADNVLVFEGEEFMGKSMALEVLGGEWFVANKLNIADKGTLELTGKSWIIELAELASMKQSETGDQKAFFSASSDDFRLSYARRVRKFPRRCVFAGTTNETQYLFSLTGNRRFWSVWCGEIDIDALRRDRDQLWAEAANIVLAGETCPDCKGIEHRCAVHRWWLDLEQTKTAELVSVSRLKSDYSDLIRREWLKKPLDKRDHLTVEQVLTDFLDLPIDRLSHQRNGIGLALKSLGFVKARRRTVEGGREWVYYPSEELKTAQVSAVNPRLVLLRNIATANVPRPAE